MATASSAPVTTVSVMAVPSRGLVGTVTSAPRYPYGWGSQAPRCARGRFRRSASLAADAAYFTRGGQRARVPMPGEDPPQ